MDKLQIGPSPSPIGTPTVTSSPAPPSPFRYDRDSGTFISHGPKTKGNRCQLVPPCMRGKHRYSEDGKSNKLGRYHWYEEGLIIDLRALQKGKIYRGDDFLDRARAWYKAEIDRLTHLERVREDAAALERAQAQRKPEEQKAAQEKEPKVDLPLQPATEEHPQEASKTKTKRKKAAPTAPTRVQPPRTAKRKAVEPPPAAPEATKKVKIIPKSPEPEPTSEFKPEPIPTTSKPDPLNHRTPTPPPPQPTISLPKPNEYGANSEKKPAGTKETKGDYQLAPYDWASYKSHVSAREAASLHSNTKKEDTSVSPSVFFTWPYVHPQGDAAYFITRLERAIDARVADLESHFAMLHERGGSMPVCALVEGHTIAGRFQAAAESSERSSEADKKVVYGARRLLVEKAEQGGKEERGNLVEAGGYEPAIEGQDGDVVEEPVEEVIEVAKMVGNGGEWGDPLKPLVQPETEHEAKDTDDEGSVAINLKMPDGDVKDGEKLAAAKKEDQEHHQNDPGEEHPPASPKIKPESEDSEARDLFDYYADDCNNNRDQNEQDRDMQMERELFGCEDGESKLWKFSSGGGNNGNKSGDGNGQGEERSGASSGEREIFGYDGFEEGDDEGISPLELGPPSRALSSSGDIRRKVAPEADMMISPTFPKWPPGLADEPQVEDLLSTALEISGLVFAVDICGRQSGKEEDVLFLML